MAVNTSVDWGKLERFGEYHLNAVLVGERKLAIVFRRDVDGDPVAVRIMHRPHNWEKRTISLDLIRRMGRCNEICVDFRQPNGRLMYYEYVPLDVCEQPQKDTKDPKDRAKQECPDSTPVEMPELFADVPLYNWGGLHFNNYDIVTKPTEDGKVALLFSSPNVRPCAVRVVDDYDGAPGGSLASSCHAARIADKTASNLFVAFRSDGHSVDSSVRQVSRVAPELPGVRGRSVKFIAEDEIRHFDPDSCDSAGGSYVEGVQALDTIGWEPLREIIEAAVHEAIMDNQRCTANLQQHLVRLEETQNAAESQFARLSQSIQSTQETVVGLAEAMQEMAEGSTALCDVVGARLSPLEESVRASNSTLEQMQRLSREARGFHLEVREQIVHLEDRVEDVQDSICCLHADWAEKEDEGDAVPEVSEVTSQEGFRIESDGSNRGTQVIDLRTGRPLPYVRAVKWEADARTGLPLAHVELCDVGVSATVPEDQMDAEMESLEDLPSADEPGAAVNKSRGFSLKWHSNSQAKASGRGAMWLMGAMLFGAFMGALLMNMFPLWRTSATGFPAAATISTKTPTPRPKHPKPTHKLLPVVPLKEKSTVSLCR